MEKTKDSKTTRKCKLSLNMFSFWTIVSVAVLYLVAMILALCDVTTKAVMILQNIAMVAMIIIASILAWRYVSRKNFVYKMLYFVVLVITIFGVVVPLI